MISQFIFQEPFFDPQETCLNSFHSSYDPNFIDIVQLTLTILGDCFLSGGRSAPSSLNPYPFDGVI